MVVLVDLPQGVTYFQVGLVVVCPMFLAAVHRNAAIGALEVNMRRGPIPGFRVGVGMGISSVRWQAGRSVVRVGAVGMLSYESGATADLRNRRVREGVEEIVGSEDGGAGGFLGR